MPLIAAAAATLLPILRQAGTRVLADIVDKNLPGAGGIVRELGNALGTEPTPGAIVARYKDNPDQVIAAAQEVESTDPTMWEALARTTEAVNQTMRSEQASKALFQRIWRPVFGLAFTLCFVLIAVAIVFPIFLGDAAMVAAVVNLTGLLTMFIGAGAAVLGVYVWKRTAEKQAGVA